MSIIDTSEASKILIKQGAVSPSIGGSLGNGSRQVEVPDVSQLYSQPIFSCFLIDSSGSMEPYAQSVIEGQNEMIQILRGSKKCRTDDALFIVQYLFSDEVKALHPFTQLSRNGKDRVVLLRNGNYYIPGGRTSLYKSIFYMLQDMAANIANAHLAHVAATCTVGVITDGEDTEGGVQPSEIRDVIQELQVKRILRSSVIVGATHPKFTASMLEELRVRLGFQQAISLSQNPSDIRAAFVLASQSAVSAQAAM
jgi:hypothetical protein